MINRILGFFMFVFLSFGIFATYKNQQQKTKKIERKIIVTTESGKVIEGAEISRDGDWIKIHDPEGKIWWIGNCSIISVEYK